MASQCRSTSRSTSPLNPAPCLTSGPAPLQPSFLSWLNVPFECPVPTTLCSSCCHRQPGMPALSLPELGSSPECCPRVTPGCPSAGPAVGGLRLTELKHLSSYHTVSVRVHARSWGRGSPNGLVSQALGQATGCPQTTGTPRALRLSLGRTW